MAGRRSLTTPLSGPRRKRPNRRLERSARTYAPNLVEGRRSPKYTSNIAHKVPVPGDKTADSRSRPPGTYRHILCGCTNIGSVGHLAFHRLRRPRVPYLTFSRAPRSLPG